MSTYAGIPGVPAVVVVLGADAPVPLPGGPFAWGKTAPHGAAMALSRALLRHALGPMGVLKADRMATRFLWRTIRTWQGDQPFQISQAEVLAHVEDIEETARQMEPVRQRAMLERGEVVSDRGAGIGGHSITWDNAPTPTPKGDVVK